VVGSSTTATGEWHAFLWNGVMRDLAIALPESRAETITNSGVIGGVGLTARPEAHVFRWNNGVTTELGTVSELGGDVDVAVVALTGTDIVAWRQSEASRFTSAIWHNGVKQLLDGLYPPGIPGGEAQAVAMNGRGQIVGASLLAGPAVHDVYHAVIWQNGVLRDLGVLRLFLCGDESPGRDCGASWAMDINNSGDVVGSSLDSLLGHAVLWPQGGSIRDLGLGRAVAINDAGDIAGDDYRNAFFWRQGVMSSLGSLGGNELFVRDVNALGTVIGTGQTAQGNPHVFVWKPGQAGLQDLGTGSDGADGAIAVAINGRGDILGYTCSVSSGSYCAYDATSRAILWRVKP